jgi:hypothetical protein
MNQNAPALIAGAFFFGLMFAWGRVFAGAADFPPPLDFIGGGKVQMQHALGDSDRTLDDFSASAASHQMPSAQVTLTSKIVMRTVCLLPLFN